jgi:hypothetical protein
MAILKNKRSVTTMTATMTRSASVPAERPEVQTKTSIWTEAFWVLMLGSLAVFLAVDLLWTGAALLRWNERAVDIPPPNAVERLLDSRYDDNFIAKHFPNMMFWEK